MAIAHLANQDPSEDKLSAAELDALFVEVLERDPSRDWLISEVLDDLGIAYSLLVSQRWIALLVEGRVDRVAPARYRAIAR